MQSSYLHYVPIGFISVPLAISAGEALKNVSHPGQNAGQQVGSTIAGLGWGAAALGLGGAAFLVRPSKVKKQVEKGKGIFSSDKVTKAGESVQKQVESLREQARTFLEKHDSRQERGGSLRNQEHTPLADDIASVKYGTEEGLHRSGSSPQAEGSGEIHPPDSDSHADTHIAETNPLHINLAIR